MRVLVLGGTTEASRLAQYLAVTSIDAIFSYAGRTAMPAGQPLPTRVGGFGGVDGLADYLRTKKITHVIDATHPFAAMMSSNAVTACDQTGTHLLALERPAWLPETGDDWQIVPDIAAAVAALPLQPARIFLAIGRQHLMLFAARPEHYYLLRVVDQPQSPLLQNADIIVARGPFTEEADTGLMRLHGITHIVAKNGGGMSARAKIDAARNLGLPVIMIDRPAISPRQVARTVEDAAAWLAHVENRGV